MLRFKFADKSNELNFHHSNFSYAINHLNGTEIHLKTGEVFVIEESCRVVRDRMQEASTKF